MSAIDHIRAQEVGDTPTVSFEFFPPKTEGMEKVLWRSIERLAPLAPQFVSVTYGAGGSTRERTHATVKRIVDETDLTPAAHLTCVEATKEEVDEVIRDYWDAGVRHIVALRGDPPEGMGHKYVPFPGGYANAAELTAGIKAIGDFEVSVGCYPEKHPESPSIEADIDLLRQKVDAGATRAITQFGFDCDVIAKYRDRVSKAGMDIPIIPGVMPIRSFKSTRSIAAKCGADVPAWLVDLFDGFEDDDDAHRYVSSMLAVEQCARLRELGFDALHFYTLNRAGLTYAVCRMLGVST